MSDHHVNQNQPYMNPFGHYAYYYPQHAQTYHPNQPRQMPQQQTQTQGAAQGILPMEQSYIENILRLNLGKEATVYMTFENNREWNAKVFKGRLEAAGRDHIILSDPKTGKRYLLLMVYLDYVTFDEKLSYEYPFQNPGQLSNYSPR